MTDTTLSIPQSKKLVRRLKLDNHLGNRRIALDFFHGFTLKQVMEYLQSAKVSVTESYVKTAIGGNNE